VEGDGEAAQVERLADRQIAEGASTGEEDDDPFAALTERERQILLLAAEGFTAAEIGRKVLVSPSTVASYRSHAMRTLGVRDRASLVRLIVDRGLLRSG
jgi:DNA-binding NarL/FixJ family response regulator